MQKILCGTFCESFDSFLDGESGLSWGAFDVHIEECGSCREHVYQILGVQGRLKEFQTQGTLLSSRSATKLFASDLQRPKLRLGAILAAVGSTFTFLALAMDMARKFSAGTYFHSSAYLGVLVTVAILPWASVLVVRHAAFIRRVLLIQLVFYLCLPISGFIGSFRYNSEYLLASLGSFLAYVSCDLVIRSINRARVSAGLTTVRSLFIESKRTKWRYRLAMVLVVSAPILITALIVKGVSAPPSPIAYSVFKSYSKEVSSLPCNPVEREKLLDSKVYL